LAEWLYEAGIGQNRAALVEGGTILEARIEREDAGHRAGAILPARYVSGSAGKGRGLVRFDDGTTALLNGLPKGVSEGATLLIEVVREAIPEKGNPKPPKVRLAGEGAIAGPGPSLLDQIIAGGLPVHHLTAIGADRLEAAGWSEVLAGAASGLIPFPGGLLRLALTPAMAIFDVDGELPTAELARAGAHAAASAVRVLDIGGSIGIDLPLPRDAPKALRQTLASEADAALPQPFERTAVNGFGFLQIVRRRERPSLPELLQADPVLSEAMALLRRAERTGGAGARTLVAAPALLARLAARPEWLEELTRRLGAPIRLRDNAGAPISRWHVEADHP
jgi:hypothetical protein